jgi:hypothetical protein
VTSYAGAVTVHRRMVTGRDIYGDDIYTDVDALVDVIAFAPGASVEVTQSRDTITTQPAVYLPAGTRRRRPVSHHCRRCPVRRRRQPERLAVPVLRVGSRDRGPFEGGDRVSSFRLDVAGFGEFLCGPAMQAEMRRRAEKVKARAEATAPVDRNSRHAGRYKRSFRVVSGVREGKTRRAFGRVVNDAPEATLVEYGSRNNPRHRTLGRLSMQRPASLLDAIADPLATVLRAAADWLDGEPGELYEPDEPAARGWRIDDRGQAVPVGEEG